VLHYWYVPQVAILNTTSNILGSYLKILKNKTPTSLIALKNQLKENSHEKKQERCKPTNA
jgi:hypothetical protein